MNGVAIISGFVAAVVLMLVVEIVKGMAAAEAQTRLERLPLALLRLARRRLPAHRRQAIHDEEWQPELIHIMRQTEGLPITRFVRATRFAFGLVVTAKSVSRRLGDVRETRTAPPAFVPVSLGPDVDVRTIRARLLQAADEERRRIQINIHDGAQIHLLGLLMQVAALRKQPPSATDPEWQRRLDEFEMTARHAIDNLRSLSAGIYPADLRDGGLTEALTRLAKHAVPPATAAVSDLPRAPSEVETALYFCCAEALQNVAKHTGRAARVRAWTEGGALHLEVADDGPGFYPNCEVRGMGLHNMVDRLEAVGGTVAIESRRGTGTTVRARVAVTGHHG